MYREEMAHKKIGTLAGILITFAIVGAILATMFILSFIGFLLNLPWLQLFCFRDRCARGIFRCQALYDGLCLCDRGRQDTFLAAGSVRAKKNFPRFRCATSGKWMFTQRWKKSLPDGKKYKYTFRKKKDAYVVDCGDIAILFSPSETLKEKLKAR